MKTRAPWLVYTPVWFKQWCVESLLWLWDLAGRHVFLYLFLVMFGFFCLLWNEEGFWVGLIGGNLIGLVVAIIFGLGGFALLVCLCFFAEIACAPFYFIAQYFDWKLPEVPDRLAGLMENVELNKRLEQSRATDFRSHDNNLEVQRLKNQNSLLKIGLLLFGIDWFFDHFRDD